jgi:transcription antitermination factor NusA-like protein
LSSLSGDQEPHFMDLWKLQEKEKGLVFGEEGENVSRVSKTFGRWVCEWPS